MKNESEIHIYTASFGKNPSVLIKTTRTFAMELLRKLENTAGKKDIIFINNEHNFPWLALKTDKIIFYVYHNQILKIHFS